MNANRESRLWILGVPVDCLTQTRALEWVDSALSTPGHKRIMAVNPEKVIAARKDSKLLNFLEESHLLIPDGIGVVMAARILGLARMERVAGADLMPQICERAMRGNYKVFIFGAKPAVNLESVEILKKRFPGLHIVGSAHGYLEEKDMDNLVERINASAADILFIALGSPRQEKWLEQYGNRLDVRVSQGIGGTLDTIVGTVKRAPKIFQKLHLEWFYRLITNPKRARRQAALPAFIKLVIKDRLMNASLRVSKT